MNQYTTPTRTVRVEGIDLTPYDVIVSLRQRIGQSANAHEVDIEDPTVTLDGTDTLVTFSLTQAQTGGFAPGAVDVQVNYGAGSARMSTGILQMRMARNLLDGEVQFAAGTAPGTTEEELAATIDTMPPKGSITSEYLADGAVGPDKLDPSSYVVLSVADVEGMFGE